jgi:predicted phosphodiesterase
MKSNTCKILFISDIHMGKPRLNPESVRNNMERYVYSRIPEVDLIVLGGDFFDSALTMNSDAGLYSVMIIDELLSIAYSNKVFVRVVTGTFFHDRHQNRMFEVMGERYEHIDGTPFVKVASTVELEFIRSLGLTMVYSPDDQPGDPTDRILEVIRSHKLDQVDFICSHGYYEMLLPRGIPHTPHNLIRYDAVKPRVRGGILNGHVHVMRLHEKLFNVGSFERFAHGEEGNKGYLILEYDKDTFNVECETVINRHATEFITMPPISRFKSMEHFIDEVNCLIVRYRKAVENDNAPMYIRLDGVTSAEDYLVKYFDEKYDNIFVTTKSNKAQDDEEVVAEVTTSLPVITETNLPELIYENIKDEGITLEQIKELL